MFRPGYLSYGSFGMVAAHELTVGSHHLTIRVALIRFDSTLLTLPADYTINKANLRNGGLVRLAMPTKFVKTVSLNSIPVGCPSELCSTLPDCEIIRVYCR